MAKPTKMHNVRRTNPKGIPFRGTCVLCGQDDMTMKEAMTTECPNQRELTGDEALLEAINPQDH